MIYFWPNGPWFTLPASGQPRVASRGSRMKLPPDSAFAGPRRHIDVARRGQLAPPAADDVVTSLFRAHGLSLIRLAVLLVGDQAREIMALRYYLDLPQDEIAALLGVSRGTVSSTISRALATLGRDLQEEP